MSSINNWNQISNLLDFEDNKGYLLLVMKREKDNNSKIKRPVIKTYNIQSKKYFLDKEEEITKLCNFFNARAYICLNSFNTKTIGLYLIKEISESLIENIPKDFDRIFSSVVVKNLKNKIFVVDIDSKDEDYILKIKSLIPKDKYITTIPTVNGVHILTKRCDIRELEALENGPDIQKDGFTLLYK